MLLLTALSMPAQPGGGEDLWPMPEWPRAEPKELGMDAAKLDRARAYALTAGGSGIVTRGGKVVLSWGDQARRYDLKSTTKSIGATALGLALADGKIKGLKDKARTYHAALGTPPEANAETGWLEKITLFHLATQTAGFEKTGDFGKLLFEPGSKFSYSDGGPNWLAECLTLIYRQDLRELMFRRVFTPLGITARDLTWRKNAYRPAKIEGLTRREFGAGIHANVDAMARIGYLYLRGGRWQQEQLVPGRFIDLARATPQALRGLEVVYDRRRFVGAPNHYGLLWWNNSDGTLKDVPRDAYWSYGLYDSFIVVIPSLDIVVARAGPGLQKGRGDHTQVLGRLLGPIVAAAEPGTSRPARRSAPAARAAPCPPSPVITAITWAPASSIIRKANGSDNWPITWGDDDALYTAYGDGWGFQPKVSGKLSLGLARITGLPEGFQAVNIRSASGEQKGDGPRGRKASGMLCVGGVLYMWVRNANRRGEQSELAVSADHGKTWRWPKWKFAELGYPCFLNFGKDYAGARDGYVYVFSPDTPSAYRAADRVVLARVPKGRIAERGAYEFFRKLGPDGRPLFSADIAERGAVFAFKGGCNRLAVTYNAPLGRYLMSMRSRGAGGGNNHFGIYDAPEPWGPWTTVFHTDKWDVDPGEAQHIPAKWISADGRTLHLVFSGHDSFCVRRAALEISKPGR